MAHLRHAFAAWGYAPVKTIQLSASEREVYSVLTLNPDMRTTDSMAILEQAFDSQMTTRNWNTVTKITEISL